MQDDVGQSGDAPKAWRPIKVGQQRAGAVGAPPGGLARIAEQRVDPVSAKQEGKSAACDVSAADDE